MGRVGEGSSTRGNHDEEMVSHHPGVFFQVGDHGS